MTSDDWLPIETAPRDGTRINLRYAKMFGIHEFFVYGQWDTERSARNPRPYWKHDLEYLTGIVWSRKNAPTHWQPVAGPLSPDV